MRLAAHWQIIGALVVGALVGAVVQAQGWSGAIPVFALGGDLFLRALKLVIVPLVFSSIVTGICGVGETAGFARLGWKTLAYYLASSLAAILVGLILFNLLDPGLVDGQPNPEVRALIDANREGFEESVAAAVDEGERRGLGVVVEILQRMVPTNMVEAASDNGQLLGLIVISLLTAFGILKMRGDGKGHLVGFFKGLNALMLTVTGWVMVLAPIGVFCLVAQTVSVTGFGVFAQLAKYVATVLLGLSVHLLLVLPLFLALVARVDPRLHFAAMRGALVTAFSTASSSATLPVTMRCLQENAGVSKRVSSFVLPLGATVNMDGTALYECVAVLFVGQVLGQALGVGDQVLVVVLALLTSIGVAGVPQASWVAIVIIINNVGVAGAGAALGLIFSVDRILDMTRTAVNIFSDSVGAVAIARSEGEAVFAGRDRAEEAGSPPAQEP